MGCSTNSMAPASRASGAEVNRPINRQASQPCKAPQANSQSPQYCPTSTVPRSALKKNASSGIASA